MPSLLKRASPTITDMIRFDHSHTLITYHQYTADKMSVTKRSLAETICAALEIHATLEEEIFYPALQAFAASEPVLQKSEPEHQAMRALIAQIRSTDASLPLHAELVHKLMQEVIHHVADEEAVLLPMAEQRLSKQQLCELGAEMTKRRMELVAPQAGKLAVNTFVGMSGSTVVKTIGAIAAVAALGMLGQHKRPVKS
ncbi:MAG: hemerythrin domain-containing protein [Oxalicibacterium faecigallinarum]|uniref:Hemerythrin-like domain-containing protein n=1 Tax=Oxalicibacterium faecigallinarum TaxID=573741 RepID=A0A8J3ARK3_9BURK|nr:hemerythrin domain-containing protein [Oxalicibacterium faecigallinarum]MDQ7970119.1 hemerythrin domain-containing protein [Oxalicibacterium faecigallinarum]GGI18374.1 hypothetical protein GCM10008066_13690 [Oxalicibacterium faecigallinarum]